MGFYYEEKEKGTKIKVTKKTSQSDHKKSGCEALISYCYHKELTTPTLTVIRITDLQSADGSIS